MIITRLDPEPMFLPHCTDCKVPVERFTIIGPSSDGFRICFWAECHGKTEYVEADAEQVIRRKYVLVSFRKKAFNHVNMAEG